MSLENQLLTPVTSPKLFVFVLMPFSEEFDDVYRLAIKAACTNAGVYCERVDEQIFQGSILERVYNQISKADLIIADMTGRNPNVFYEVGYAHALNKNVILLTRNAADIPFDLRHYQHIVYSKMHALEVELERRVKWYVDHAADATPTAPEMLQLFYGGKLFQSPQAIRVKAADFEADVYLDVSFSLYNPTSQTLLGEKYRLSIIMPKRFYFLETPGYRADNIPQPDGRFMYLLPSISDMLPGSWRAVSFSLKGPKELKREGLLPGTLRVFTEVGSKDYELQLDLYGED